MSDSKIALAIAAHPDDVEFMMAGTLALLADAGYECHIFTVANGNCGTAVHSNDEIIRIRAAEGHSAASVIGATYHEGLVNDLEIFYEPETLRRVTAVIREIKPQIVLTQSPQDLWTTRMRAGLPYRVLQPWHAQLISHPWVDDDAGRYLYMLSHTATWAAAEPILRRFSSHVTEKIDVKEEMLRRHASQKEWLDVSQGKAPIWSRCASCARRWVSWPAQGAYGEASASTSTLGSRRRTATS